MQQSTNLKTWQTVIKLPILSNVWFILPWESLIKSQPTALILPVTLSDAQTQFRLIRP